MTEGALDSSEQRRTGLRLDELDTQPIEARSLPVSPTSVADVRGARLHVEDLWLPAMVLRRDALVHNLDRFARWCTERGMEQAPHGKTTMSPHLWSAQLSRGAWAITAATVAQARTMRRFGVGRVLIANEVADPAALAWLRQALDDPSFEPMCLVDSPELVDVMQRHLAGASRPLSVLVELGVHGRRTGVREIAEGLALVDRIASCESMAPAGVAGFEGVLPLRREPESTDRARTWLDGLTELASTIDERGGFDDVAEIVVSAGGSGYPDLAADAMCAMPALSRPVRKVIRSGCYITHDDLSYERSSPLRSEADPDPLRPALSCIARVLSRPEPGRALLGAGKRDVPFDLDLPVARAVRRDGGRKPLSGEVSVTELNDHHMFCDVRPDTLEVGDIVEFGVSHPCTAFDKWQLIPVLDSDDRIVDAVRTLF